MSDGYFYRDYPGTWSGVDEAFVVNRMYYLLASPDYSLRLIVDDNYALHSVYYPEPGTGDGDWTEQIQM